ncbi:uncharacterized protein LOC135464454 [Liolophura sinensis]|uniref:uncharacterized protein LOC135464454 n=1 Tax=Liolophura sinensis TaxID=3198878 RepID=UPI0031589166
MATEIEVDSEEMQPETAYSNLKTLTTGAFGKILLMRAKTGNVQYAAKVMNVDPGSVLQKAARNEMNALFRLQHENIIFVKEMFVCRSGNAVWIVMELADWGNLEDHMRTSGPLSDERLTSYVSQLSRCMEFVHSNQYSHGDVTPRNLLLFSSGLLKLTDFGQSLHCPRDEQPVSVAEIIGDPRYLAPEILRGSKYYPQAADVWSTGCCVYFMFTCKHLYQGNENDIKRCQMKGQVFYPGERFYQNKYAKMREIVSRLTRYDPVSRPAFGQWSVSGLASYVEEILCTSSRMCFDESA